MHELLCIILAVLCAAVGLMGFTLIGHIILSLLGVSDVGYRRWKIAAAALGVPAALGGGIWGYLIGKSLVPPPAEESPAYVPPSIYRDLAAPVTQPASSRPASDGPDRLPASAPASTSADPAIQPETRPVTVPAS
jgi:hypothetical protein